MNRPRITVRRMMALVAIVAIVLGAVEAVKLRLRAAKYQRLAEAYARRELRCREIDAMDSETRARADEEAIDDPLLGSPDWNRDVMRRAARMKELYTYAAAHPWIIVERDHPGYDSSAPLREPHEVRPLP